MPAADAGRGAAPPTGTTMESLLFVLAGATVLLALCWPSAKPDRWTLILAAGLAAFTVAACLAWRPPSDEALRRSLPEPRREDGFVTSQTCRACHPDQYASWHRSFHRTMTQAATPEAVLAPFDGRQLSDRGRTYRVERRGDEFWVEMVDPRWDVQRAASLRSDAPPAPGERVEPPRIEARVCMTTGSHHLQAYWVGFAGVYYQFPWIFDIDAQRWIPSLDSFLTPPAPIPVQIEVWNKSCTDCHTIGTQPRVMADEQSAKTRSVELGIACEACHGPAEEHVSQNHVPLRRYLHHLGDRPDPTIVNPKRLAKERASEVCGQCHALFSETDTLRWAVEGPTYRAGDELDRTKVVFRYTEAPTDPDLAVMLQRTPDAMSGRFWSDGTMRVAGREYNGMIESACYQKGDLSCLTCHSMHGYRDRGDQLTAETAIDETCLDCHASYRERLGEHTHHAAGSPGSSCQNCHMPHTTYGLFVAMRSHRIDNPSALVTARTGRPNACNLCHLDRTLAWTAQHLTEWYGQPAVEVGEDHEKVAASVVWALRGDAVQRAIAAWSMGWPAARRASGEGWQAPFLARLLIDPYSAVRRVAYDSLRLLPRLDAFRYDYLAPPERRFDDSLVALRTWAEARAATLDRTGPQLLISPTGQLHMATIDRLMQERDDRPIRIIE